jgi:hypothetical protein
MDFTIQIGGTLIRGSLMPIVQQGKKEKAKKHLANSKGERVKQVWVDSDDNIYPKSELVYVSAETNAVITKKEYEEAHQPEELPKNVLSFAVHERSALDIIVPSNTRPYAFKPRSDKWSQLNCSALFQVLSNEDLVLLSYGIVRDSEGLFRLFTWNNRLVVRKMESPENLMDSSFEIEDLASPEDVAMMRKQLVMMVAEPELDNYRDRHLQRLTRLAQGDTLEPERHEISAFKKQVNGLIG